MTINPVVGSHRFDKTQNNYMFFVWYSSGAIFFRAGAVEAFAVRG